MTKRVLIVDKTHKVLTEILTDKGFSCEEFSGKTLEDLESVIGNYTGAIIRSKFTFNKDLLDKATNLKFIGRVGAGMESIDVEYAESKGIRCYNSPQGNMDAVGEHAVGMLLVLLNNLFTANYQVKGGIWNREENRGSEIKGKTVGIIGYGNMGSTFARKISGFGANVISYDKYKTNYSDGYTIETSLDTLMNESDIISLHVPLTDETKYMIDSKFIDKVRKPFILINTARGPVVNTADLIQAIDNNKIVGAGLDVLEFEETSFENVSMYENKTFKELVKKENVILSPHIAGWTHESKIKLAKILAEKIIENH